MFFNIVLFIVAIFPSPFVIWDCLKRYTVKEIGKGDFIGWLFFSIVPLFNHIYLIFITLNYSDWDDGFKQKIQHYNEVRTCGECNITSRRYQLKGEYSNICPHCGKSRYGSYTTDKDKTYPFAPKLTSVEFIKWKIDKNKVENIQKDLQETERIGNELQAYEQLQLKRLKELEAKANEIKMELGKKGVS